MNYKQQFETDFLPRYNIYAQIIITYESKRNKNTNLPNGEFWILRLRTRTDLQILEH